MIRNIPIELQTEQSVNDYYNVEKLKIVSRYFKMNQELLEWYTREMQALEMMRQKVLKELTGCVEEK